MRADVEMAPVDEDRLRQAERDAPNLPSHRRDAQQRLLGPGAHGAVRRQPAWPGREQGELDRVHVLVVGLLQHMERVNAAQLPHGTFLKTGF
jgi:hypothetical protein